MPLSALYPGHRLWCVLTVGDVYFDIQSIGHRYGKFVGAVEDSHVEPGESFRLIRPHIKNTW